MRTSPFVSLDRTGSIFTITLNRPEQKNALFGAMREDLLEAIERAATKARVVVIRGAGGAFCSGGDLGVMAELKKSADREKLKALIATGKKIVSRLRSLSVPTLAAVDGVAAGAGFSLALACDVRLASERARFGATFSRIGLHPDWGGSYFLTRFAGPAVAADLIFTGRLVDAREALALGLVSRVAPTEEFDTEVTRAAGELSEAAPKAIALAKRAIERASHRTLEEMLDFEESAQLACFDTADCQEGLSAFLEKRAPRFQGV